MTSVDRAELAPVLDEGFRPATAEKVHRLLGVLRELQVRRSTADQYTLKGGTALNIFHLEDLPRLSVDIDLMVTGFPQAEPGSDEREKAMEGIKATLSSLEYDVSRKRDSDEGAGATFQAFYQNHFGDDDLLKIDLDLLNRRTLMAPTELDGPELFFADDVSIPTVHRAELFAQKLAAVAYRAHPRDLFDMHQMLDLGWHALEKAREAYLAYSLLTDGEAEWYRLDYPVQLEVPYDPNDLEDVLREGHEAPTLDAIRTKANGALTGDPDYTSPTAEERKLRRELVDGDREAFAEILGVTDGDKRRQLADHPALAWRLENL